jgi:hypothetical protein
MRPMRSPRCLCLFPPYGLKAGRYIIAKQRLRKHVPVVTNTHPTTERSVSYQIFVFSDNKVYGYFFPE